MQKVGIPRSQRGFALIATLMLMILLAILVVGMLGLSAVSIRTSTQEMAKADAQANARLALMVAIGELQKQLGPDKRISARAEILDEDPASGSIDGVAHPHYLGVWDSWDTWLTDQKGSLKIQDTYKRGRDLSLFRTWLVSNPEAVKFETAILDNLSADSVVICGKGSAGPDPTKHVIVGRVPVRNGTRITGSYAWWVDDESQKARLDQKARGNATTIGQAQILASHTGRSGIETLEGMTGFDTAPESVAKMISTGQASISASSAFKNFHDITAYSLGLHTDVRSGGFKADLNLAFESENMPSQMDEATLFSGRPFDAPIRPLNGELANIVPQNPYIAPMSWRQLREHYRLYRNFSDSAVKRPVEWSGGEPSTRRHIMRSNRQNQWDMGGYTRQPVLLRQSWIIATAALVAQPGDPWVEQQGDIKYYILTIPVSTWWNPYNITLKVDSSEISTFGSLWPVVGMQKRLYVGGVEKLNRFGQPERLFPGDDLIRNGRSRNWDNNVYTGGGQPGNRMIASGPNGTGSIEFQPGEVRIFSTDVNVSSRDLIATPGYTPAEDSNSEALRGLKMRVYPYSPDVSMSLQLSPDRAGNSASFAGVPIGSTFLWYNEETQASYRSGILRDGTVVDTIMDGGAPGNVTVFPCIRLGFTSIHWAAQSELNDAWIIRDEPTMRARWGAPGSPPMPVAIFSIVAKSAEQLLYDTPSSSSAFTKDFRNRSWLHAPPTRIANLLMNPQDLNRADSPYQVHFHSVNGDQEVSQYLQADGQNGYFGGSYTPATGQTHVSIHSLPTAPVMNLGSLAGVRIDTARARILQRNDNFSNPTVERSVATIGNSNNPIQYKHTTHAGGAFGVGIGNGYAHPMIEPSKIYTRSDLGIDPGHNGNLTTKMAICDDYWDHLFLTNEELWDSWFFSGLAPEMNQGTVSKSMNSVAQSYFSGESTLLPPHFEPYLLGKTPAQLASLAETTTAAPGENGWDKIGSYMLNRGQFNVNSTSKEAWKALLMSLADRAIACNDAGVSSVIARDPKEVSLSRHNVANSATAADGPDDDHAWRGIRKLTEAQIDKLSEEIVRQVKLRGPFLNMTEFVNRRLTADATGVTAALQAAIDWDEFNAGYSGEISGSGESINAAYKNSDAMISENNLPAPYPNPKAAAGSRYAGIPGYVMQSDLLQGISSSLSVRGDTFLIRAYGESLTKDGKVAAKAWCEAVVQRLPEYVDMSDQADKTMRLPNQVPGSTLLLNPTNEKFGRQFKITGFRWLNNDEV